MIFNNDKYTTVLNTFQGYLRKTPFRIDVEENKRRYFGRQYPLGFKLVRGAYMVEEDKIAEE